jgi:hypothetical protein
MATWLSGTAIPALQTAGMNVRFVDLYASLAGHSEWAAADGHPNDAGYQEIAILEHSAVLAAAQDAIALP